MRKRYLFFAERAYSYAILRPLQREIRRRGDEVAWLLGEECPNLLEPDEILVPDIRSARRWNPVAVFSPGDWVYDMLPGVKVKVFHGYPIAKRGDNKNRHFRMRGWYDVYLTAGPSGTPEFSRLSRELGYFAVYETGWVKADSIVAAAKNAPVRDANTPKRIFVASTFSRGITSLHKFIPEIERISASQPWEWVITRHPMLNDAELESKITRLAAERPNVTYYPHSPGPEVMASTDAMLCDSSSIITEYAIMNKPIVTLNNTKPGPHLINITEPEQIEQALERALTRPPELMAAIRKYVATHEAHLEGNNCGAALDAVDRFIATDRATLPHRKPLNLFRRIKLRLHMALRWFHKC